MRNLVQITALCAPLFVCTPVAAADGDFSRAWYAFGWESVHLVLSNSPEVCDYLPNGRALGNMPYVAIVLVPAEGQPPSDNGGKLPSRHPQAGRYTITPNSTDTPNSAHKAVGTVHGDFVLGHGTPHQRHLPLVGGEVVMTATGPGMDGTFALVFEDTDGDPTHPRFQGTLRASFCAGIDSSVGH